MPLLFGLVFWPWIFVAVLSFIVVAAVEYESGFWATILFVATLITGNAIAHNGWLTFARLHPLGVVEWAIGYLVVGCVWSIAKWYLYSRDRVIEYNEGKDSFLRIKGVTELTPQLAREFQNYSSTPDIPVAREHKGTIILWMSYWPFSILGFLFNDFIKKIFNHLFEFLQSTYQRISDSVFSSVREDQELAKRYNEPTNR